MATTAYLPKGWEKAELATLQAPDTAANETFEDNWFDEEHGDSGLTGGDYGGKYNLFDTTLPLGRSTSYNSVGVQNYTSFKTGEEANAETIEEPDYAQLLSDLRSGSASVKTLETDEQASPWGTSFGTPSDTALPVPPTSKSAAKAATLDSSIVDCTLNPALCAAGGGIDLNPLSGVESSVASAAEKVGITAVFIVGGLAIAVGGFVLLAKGPAESAAKAGALA